MAKTEKIGQFQGGTRSIPAVVLGLGVNGLGVVRSLSRAGIPVIGIYTRPGEAGRFSKHCKAKQFPILEIHEPEFLDQLVSLGAGLDQPPLFPTSDQYLQFLSDHRQVLETYYRFNIVDQSTLEMIVKKNGTQVLAERCGVPIPKTYTPLHEEEIFEISQQDLFPYIIKPLDTFSVQFPQGAKNLIVRSVRELREFYHSNPTCFGQTIVQQVISGGDGHIFICTVYFNAASQPLAVYTGRKIRQYPPDYGVTCLGESCYVAELESLTVTFLKKIKFCGVGTAEFVRDRKNGSFAFIELNARSYYHNQLFTDCGVNFAAIAYRDLLGEEALPPPQQKEGLWWIDFQRDLSSCWRKYKQGEITWGVWLRTVIRARSFANWDRRDPGPFLYATWLLVKIILQKIIVLPLKKLPGPLRIIGSAKG